MGFPLARRKTQGFTVEDRKVMIAEIPHTASPG
jgi:hypothetical protein